MSQHEMSAGLFCRWTMSLDDDDHHHHVAHGHVQVHVHGHVAHAHVQVHITCVSEHDLPCWSPS